ncbi:MAG: MBL fold metallo-hydrolase [Prevotella sp.]|nr:MBL fold metallo-hydrolase [Prevotella sp.]
MINVQRFICNMLDENCYVVSDETKECVIIDCGAFYDEERIAIVDYIRTNGLTPKRLLATHGHLDHNFGNTTIFEQFGLRPEIAKEDERMMNNLHAQAETFYHMQLEEEYPAVERFFEEDESITFGNQTLQIIPTPGHSRGSVCFYNKKENVLFTGDTLFQMSIGRTDLQGGSMMQIIQSLRTLAQLPDETIVLPGHGGQTTIGEELKHNPYMDR